MAWNQELDRISVCPHVAEQAARMAALAESAAHLSEFERQALALLSQTVDHVEMALVSMYSGQWIRRAATPGFDESGKTADIPVDLLSEALDRDAAQQSPQGWTVAPLPIRDQTLVLAAHCHSKQRPSLETVAAQAALLAAGRGQLTDRLLLKRRIRRLETILKIGQQWRQTQDLSSLLEMMAEASTELMGAERASIFLWDKPNKLLVGRPALGVEGGELRIKDDQGVVGDVVQTGQLRRVDADPHDQREIDRSVDQQLNFETRTLLCAPLRGAKGELLGAFELINKREGNFSKDDEEALMELAEHASIALESRQQYEHLVRSREQVAAEAAGGVALIGECSAIQALRSKIARVAKTDLAVLILGENGCGKEVVSQMIHYLSERKSEPFVAVNCAAITESLLESELFGHEAGAFTDARETRIGKFELAAEGTLFLDEIGDMSAGGQAKLLRVLEEKVVVRVGGANPIHTNSRVVAATNQDLTELVREKRFREDLFFRLNVVTLELPPLCERGDDILLLANHFLEEFSLKARRATPKLMASARKRLLTHSWPGNVRELRNVMERLAFLSIADQVDEDELALNLSTGSTQSSDGVPENLELNDATKAFQIDYIRRRIDRSRGNVALAARELGLHRSNLYRKMRQLGMDP